MWHSHQLCPVSYCNDMMLLLGMVVQHDDDNSDKSTGKLYDGFIETMKQFEDTFGLRYWRAGTLYRGSEPTALTMIPASVTQVEDGVDAFKSCTGLLSLPRVSIVQVIYLVILLCPYFNFMQCYNPINAVKLNWAFMSAYLNL